MNLEIKRNKGNNIGKNVSCKYSQKFDHGKQFATDTFKTASKREVQKKAKKQLIQLVIKLHINLQGLSEFSDKPRFSQIKTNYQKLQNADIMRLFSKINLPFCLKY